MRKIICGITLSLLLSSAVFAEDKLVIDLQVPDIETLEKAQMAAGTLLKLGKNHIPFLLMGMPSEVDFKYIDGKFTRVIDLSSGGALACEALLCAVGVAIPESRTQCLKVLRKWSVYLATLSIFSRPPKCPSQDSQGNITGYNDMTCNVIQDIEMRNLCLEANGEDGTPKPPPRHDPCKDLLGLDYELCKVDQCNKRHGSGNVCKIL